MKRQSKDWIKKQLLIGLTLPENRINGKSIDNELYTMNSRHYRKFTEDNFFLAVQISIYKTVEHGTVLISHIDVEDFHIFKNNGEDAKIVIRKSELENRIKILLRSKYIKNAKN